jgi:hypothetical protein
MDKILSANQAELITNAETLGDTIRVLENNRLSLTHPDTHKDPHLKLLNGSRLIRYFRKGDHYYVLLTGSDKRFGWLVLPDDRYWIKSDHKTNNIVSDSVDDIFNSIVARVKKVNSIFSDVFKILNRKTNRQNTVPQWIIEQQGKTLQLRFTPADYSSAFNKTNIRFIQEISLYLLGSNYRLEKSENLNQVTIYAPNIN